MGRILNLFGRSVSLEKGPELSEDDSAERRAKGQSVDYDVLGIDGVDVEIFEALAETQQSIEGPVASVIDGLANMKNLATQMSTLQRNFSALFEDYRGMTAASLKLGQDRERLSTQYRDKSQEVETLRNETTSLRWDLDSVRGHLARAQSDAEGFDKRIHLLEVSKKDLEQQLVATLSNLRTVGDEAEGYKLELASLRQQVEADVAKINELSAKHHEAYERSLLLADRCTNYETTLRNSNEQISALQGNIDNLSQQRDSFASIAQQKDVENAQLRADLSKSFERFQADMKARDRDLAEARAENEHYRSSTKVHEQVNLELKFENEAKTSQLRHQQEVITKLELTVSQQEAKLARFSSDLDSALTAKAQTDQSRAAMASRVESVAQALRGREADVYRLETEVAKLSNQLEDQGGRSRGMIEALQTRVFELEKDLAAQKNETAYYYAQVEIMKKPENRMPNT